MPCLAVGFEGKPPPYDSYHYPMVVRVLLVLLSAALVGCASPPRGLDSPVPVSRASAAARAAAAGDRAAIPDLITMLESDDPVIRMVAHRALVDITGEDLGYEFAASEPSRKAAAERWRAWLRERESHGDKPTNLGVMGEEGREDEGGPSAGLPAGGGENCAPSGGLAAFGATLYAQGWLWSMPTLDQFVA